MRVYSEFIFDGACVFNCGAFVKNELRAPKVLLHMCDSEHSIEALLGEH
jgi:hypothetical protein